jgi:hypothetical protein
MASGIEAKNFRGIEGEPQLLKSLHDFSSIVRIRLPAVLTASLCRIAILLKTGN